MVVIDGIKNTGHFHQTVVATGHDSSKNGGGDRGRQEALVVNMIDDSYYADSVFYVNIHFVILSSGINGRPKLVHLIVRCKSETQQC